MRIFKYSLGEKVNTEFDGPGVVIGQYLSIIKDGEEFRQYAIEFNENEICMYDEEGLTPIWTRLN